MEHRDREKDRNETEADPDVDNIDTFAHAYIDAPMLAGMQASKSVYTENFQRNLIS
jgi:hypothetical protein